MYTPGNYKSHRKQPVNSGPVAVIKGQLEVQGSSEIVSDEVAKYTQAQEYGEQFPCNSGTTVKCPAVNW